MREMTKSMAEQYLQNMSEDGWIFKPIFGDKGYLKGQREGFEIHIDIREKANDDFDSVIGRINIWNEKNLYVEPSYPTYDWEQIKKNQLKCDFCNQYVDSVVRVGFANKACKDCADDARKMMEYDGWYD